MSAISTGPPPWPLPPSWAPPPANPAEPPKEQPPAPAEPPATPEPGTSDGAVVVFGADAAVEGVERRPMPEAADGFELAHELARMAGQAAGEGARGIVAAPDVAAPEELAWALELLYAGEAPLVLAPGPGDLADAVAVAGSGVRGLGCVLVSRGDVHAARHVARTGAASFGSPAAGPLGRVGGGSARLLWRTPGRVTVTARPGDRQPLVALHTVGLGDDGRALRLLAEHCNGLVVAGPAPERLTAALPELGIPVVLAGPYDGPLPATTLDPPKARILMHLLLEAGRDREGVLAAFTAVEQPEGARL